MTTHLSIRTGFLEHSEIKKSSGSGKLVLSGSERGAASSCCLVCKTLTTFSLYKSCTQIFHFHSPTDLFGSPAAVFMCCEPVIMPDHHTFVCASPLLLAEQCCEVVHVRFASPQHMTHSDVHYFKRRVEVVVELRIRHMTSTRETRAQVTSRVLNLFMSSL